MIYSMCYACTCISLFFFFWTVFLQNICRTKFAFFSALGSGWQWEPVFGDADWYITRWRRGGNCNLSTRRTSRIVSSFGSGYVLAVGPASWTGSVLVILTSVAALSKPHLFESRGHNRQGSDSSVDCFAPKEEPPEPEPDNKVQAVFYLFIF